MTPNSSSICCTSLANRSLRVEYETWIVFRGNTEQDPSPSKRACRKARLTAAGSCQSHSRTSFSADRCPHKPPSRDFFNAVRLWISNSYSVEPERIVLVET